MKRLSDLIVSFFGLMGLLPMLLVISGLLKLDGGPVFFRQERVGLRGRRFRVYKFRSMLASWSGPGAQVTAANDLRITPLGQWLRKTKWDEWPQLLNVLRGEMSLVGPRPEVPRYVDMWPAADRDAVLSVRPGLTDFAALYYFDEQAILAGAADPEESYVRDILPRKVELYRKYVRERNVGLDLRLILRTLVRIAYRKRLIREGTIGAL